MYRPVYEEPNSREEERRSSAKPYASGEARTVEGTPSFRGGAYESANSLGKKAVSWAVDAGASDAPLPSLGDAFRARKRDVADRIQERREHKAEDESGAAERRETFGQPADGEKRYAGGRTKEEILEARRKMMRARPALKRGKGEEKKKEAKVETSRERRQRELQERLGRG